jgi:hypothetical protein
MTKYKITEATDGHIAIRIKSQFLFDSVFIEGIPGLLYLGTMYNWPINFIRSSY